MNNIPYRDIECRAGGEKAIDVQVLALWRGYLGLGNMHGKNFRFSNVCDVFCRLTIPSFRSPIEGIVVLVHF